MAVYVGIEVFIIGCPMGIAVTSSKSDYSFPIWKRGTIASEPEDGGDVVLIDSATREGMSGSPVIVRKDSNFIDEQGVTNMAGGLHSKFIGVYSGRVDRNTFNAQIGKIWRKELICEIIKHNKTDYFSSHCPKISCILCKTLDSEAKS